MTKGLKAIGRLYKDMIHSIRYGGRLPRWIYVVSLVNIFLWLPAFFGLMIFDGECE